jgi:hypothetical protein
MHAPGGSIVWWIAASLAAGLAASACRFDPGGVPGDGGASALDGAEVVDAASGSDGPAAPDAALPPPIDAAPALPPGTLPSRFRTAPIVLDTEDDDWTDATFLEFDIADAAQTFGVNPQYQPSVSVRFASMHDAQYIYFFLDVTDDVIVMDSAELYQDDAVHLYIDAAGDRLGPYAQDDHEIVIAPSGSYRDYAPAPAPISLQGMVRQHADGYTMELRIAKSSLGVASLPAALGFNLALTDDDGIGNRDADAYGLWFLNPAERCQTCCTTFAQAQAWCDTTTFGQLLLLPPGS